MRRQRASRPTAGRRGGVGLRRATMRSMAEPPSRSKSPFSSPNGRREGISPLEQVQRMVRVSRSNEMGRPVRSTRERESSVEPPPSGPALRRTAFQKVGSFWREPWRKEKKGSNLTVDRKSTRLNSSHLVISYAVFCLKKKK